MKCGTRYSYDMGCRCDECRAAKMADRRLARARARAANTSGYRRELATSRALKESYRGTCVDCGARTTGCYGPGLAPNRCVRCTARIVGLSRRGQGPTEKRVLTLISANGGARFMEIVNGAGLSKGHTAGLLNRLVNYGLVKRPARGFYVVSE